MKLQDTPSQTPAQCSQIHNRVVAGVNAHVAAVSHHPELFEIKYSAANIATVMEYLCCVTITRGRSDVVPDYVRDICTVIREYTVESFNPFAPWADRWSGDLGAPALAPITVHIESKPKMHGNC